MNKLHYITDTAVPLQQEDIDTDQIIPARFLKATSREGFGSNLFRDWRYDSNNNVNPHFVLNNDLFKGSILIAGKNFGCGSSREHAAWALHDYGFRVVISSFFADIFKGNALNNGLLPIQVEDQTLINIFQIIEQDAKAQFAINVETQELSCEKYNLSVSFEIDEYKKYCFINNLSDLDLLISMKEKIELFETNQIIF